MAARVVAIVTRSAWRIRSSAPRDGMRPPFSYLRTVFTASPARDASSAWVRPTRSRSSRLIDRQERPGSDAERAALAALEPMFAVRLLTASSEVRLRTMCAIRQCAARKPALTSDVKMLSGSRCAAHGVVLESPTALVCSYPALIAEGRLGDAVCTRREYGSRGRRRHRPHRHNGHKIVKRFLASESCVNRRRPHRGPADSSHAGPSMGA